MHLNSNPQAQQPAEHPHGVPAAADGGDGLRFHQEVKGVSVLLKRREGGFISCLAFGEEEEKRKEALCLLLALALPWLGGMR